jgi:hypothetical protein
MDLLVDKVEEGKKKFFEISERFQESKFKLQTSDHKLGSSNVWIDGLVHQIQFMTYGNGIITTPLLIENFVTLSVGNLQLVLVTNCLIYGFYYACKNIVVASCGCTYHLFCMVIYMENKTIVWANATYGKPLDIN